MFVINKLYIQQDNCKDSQFINAQVKFPLHIK